MSELDVLVRAITGGAAGQRFAGLGQPMVRAFVRRTIFPARRQLQQIHYLYRDGRSLGCWFDLPPGTVGRFRAAIKLWRGADESIEPQPSLRYEVVVGGTARAYDNELFVVPCWRTRK